MGTGGEKVIHGASKGGGKRRAREAEKDDPVGLRDPLLELLSLLSLAQFLGYIRLAPPNSAHICNWGVAMPIIQLAPSFDAMTRGAENRHFGYQYCPQAPKDRVGQRQTRITTHVFRIKRSNPQRTRGIVMPQKQPNWVTWREL